MLCVPAREMDSIKQPAACGSPGGPTVSTSGPTEGAMDK